ncbi:hypothetical protein GQ41_0531 [Arenibacter algicola]|jgi:disulfide bond formation protein DsbB|uniref:Gliding motility protein GldL n=1 Tax=Arenibacter algicola TaxID=616991 RepID=A0ABY3AB19_9FLAO|nr:MULTISPECIES: hypothetical protein [Arenibacter]GBF19872.1 hypothetical protein C21_02043 [Arenibacter sp. NBRC 103722]|tara:strand:- start:14553 stop:14750 length:198 start_codon:yes stop_codon:yes gene_type:complete
MKTKRTFYLVLIVAGALIAGMGDHIMQREYALSIGIVLLMFGLYKTTQLWSIDQNGDGEKDKEKN